MYLKQPLDEGLIIGDVDVLSDLLYPNLGLLLANKYSLTPAVLRVLLDDPLS